MDRLELRMDHSDLDQERQIRVDMHERFELAEDFRQIAAARAARTVPSRCVEPGDPIQFWIVRNSPGLLFWPRTPCMSSAWISRISRSETGSS